MLSYHNNGVHHPPNALISYTLPTTNKKKEHVEGFISTKIWYQSATIRLCLVPEKFEEKCERKKIQRKSRRKEKVKKNKKID